VSDNPDQSLDIAQPSTQSTGTLSQSIHRSVLSVITDAGDQQFKRQKRASDREEAISQSPGANQEKPTSPEWAESFPIVLSPGSEFDNQHELNCQLFAALQRTRDPRDKGFLPKRQLDRLVNPDSVFRELSKSLSQTLSIKYITKCANTICTETEVVLGKGKKRIKSFRKIFALLVLVEKSSSICMFLQENVSDLDLPLVAVRNGGSIELRRRDGSDKPSSEVLNCFSQWSPVRKKDFEEYQWTMLAPFFTQGHYNKVAHYVLKDQHILPFVFTQEEEDDNTEITGGFGRVFMVRIHPEHHNFRVPMHCDRGFAIKQLRESDRLSFKREVDILKKFTGEKSHPHVVSLLATYEQFNKFHLIFYRAEGNLFDYWRKVNSSPKFDYTSVLWMAKQCAGIAHGLLRLHRHYTIAPPSSIPNYDKEEEFKRRSTSEKHVRLVEPVLQIERENPSQSSDNQQTELASPTSAPAISRTNSERQASLPRRPTGERPARLVNEPYTDNRVRQWGRHGDLKPENILWFRHSEDENGILRVCDFGAAELNSRWSKSKRRDVANTMTYRPPECDLQPKIIRQSYDIWCLGCVYLEFVTWMLGGVKLWRDFAKQRLAWDVFQSTETDTFFEIVKTPDTGEARVMVKEVVTKVRTQTSLRSPTQEKRANQHLFPVQFFDKLHTHPNCTEYFHEFLDMIKHNMLVVEPDTVYKTRRMYCEEVSETLKKAYQKCRKDVDYAIKKRPWTSRRLTAEPLTESVKISMTDEAKEVIAENLRILRPHWGTMDPPTSLTE
jgi:serine/threonine protein kinase